MEDGDVNKINDRSWYLCMLFFETEENLKILHNS